MNKQQGSAFLNRFRPRHRRAIWPRHTLSGMLVIGLLSGSLLGCGSDTTGPAPLTPAQAYWALQLNYRALNMATVTPADTVRLIATPVNAEGTLLPGAGSATFHASDSTVTVDSTGLVTAHYPTTSQPTTVTASLTVQGITLTATALIRVTNTIPQYPLATFSIQPAPDDSAKRSVDFFGDGSFATGGGASFPWPVIATNTAQDTICNSTTCPLLVSYTASNPLVATIDSLTGLVSSRGIGHVTFTAATWAYGVAKRDSVAFTIGYKASYTMDMALSEQAGVSILKFPKQLILGVGATVLFSCGISGLVTCDHPVDVVFDDPTAVDSTSVVLFWGTLPSSGSGNIPAFGGDTASINSLEEYIAKSMNDVRARRFPAPGTYRYHSTLFPSDTGTIIIKEQQ